MQKTDPFCKCISKWLSNDKAPKYEANLFTHIKGLLYKHIMDTNQRFMALIIPQAWKYTVLVEAHDKLETPRTNLHILPHQTTILLERNEQGQLEIYS